MSLNAVKFGTVVDEMCRENLPFIDEEVVPIRTERETYCDKGLTFKCRHFDPVPAQMAKGVRARDLHVI